MDMDRDSNLVWMDLEMTGLKPETDVILEVATIVTDSDLNELAQGPIIAIHQTESVLAGMNDWCQRHHAASGLIERVRQSEVDCREAEVATLDFVRAWVNPGKSPLCGNTIWHDRCFLLARMPELEHWFHYRNIDVSTLKELASRWRPDLPHFGKDHRHLALPDIRESIAELRYYREHLLVQAG